MQDRQTSGAVPRTVVNASELPTVQRETSLSERVYEALRDAILTGTLPPGQRLVESTIASKMQTSKTPVREAFLRLEREGLVSVQSGNGAHVGKLSMRELRDLDHVRRLLEIAALTLAASRLQEEDIEKAEQCLRNMRLLAQLGDWNGYWQEHRSFHTTLFGASGNLILTGILLGLQRTATRYSRICLEASPPLWLYDEGNHELLMEALKQADLQQIQRIVNDMNDWFMDQFQTVSENAEGDLAPYFE